jgi:type II secretory pathway pseudopilin PulG
MQTSRRTQQGFSLYELIVVIGVIMVVAAFSLPQVAGYTRMYRIRTATQQVSSQLQTARNKAVMRNTILGVAWMPRAGDSGWVIEDDLLPQATPNWSTRAAENFPTIIAIPAQTSGFTALPDGIVFDNPANCPNGGTANAWAVRFSALGAACGLGADADNCPPPGTPPGSVASRIYVNGGQASVCLLDQRINLRRQITITAGGRILTQ